MGDAGRDPKERPMHLRGTLLPDGSKADIYVTDGRITFTPVAGAETIVDDGYLLPGLVDTHAHLALASPAPADAPPPEAVRASARVQLDRGVLLVREPGSPTRDSRDIGPDERLPRVITGGRFLAAPGGYFPGMAREVPGEDLAAAAVEEFRASGHWAKVVGDFLDADGIIRPTLEPGQLRAATEAVHAVGGLLAVHAMAAGTIEMAIAAAVDSIEHATELAPEHLSAIAAGGIVVVPTMIIGAAILQTVQGFGSPLHELERWERAVARQAEMVRRATQAGVTIMAGTDAGMVAHGLILDEVRSLSTAGVDADVALGAASWSARRWLGLPGLEEGAPADMVAFPYDPRTVDPAGKPSVRILDGRLIV
jgi:imidazolonepropionase-like amidohydrolase